MKYPAILVFSLTFLFGDETVYFFGFLSGQGLIPVWIVIVFSILGNGGCDVFWFCIARNRYTGKIKSFFLKIFFKEDIIDSKIVEKTFSKKKMFYTLLFSKFFYGTRLLTIFYVSHKEKDFKKIIIFNTFAEIVWVICVTAIMFIIGKVTQINFTDIESFRKVLGIAILIAVAIYLFNRLVLRRIINHKKEK